MKSRGFVLGSLALAAASLGWWSCSGQSSDEHPKNDAGAGAAGAGGAGAAGGTHPGGAGGVGNSGGIDWGPAPKWESSGLVVATCAIERLANASEIRMFAWQPCAWAPNDCQQALVNPALVGNHPVFGGVVNDDGATARVALGFSSPKVATVAATEDGTGLVGLRPATASPTCILGISSIVGKRFGVVVGANISEQTGTGDLGGLLGDLDASGSSPVGFTLSAKPPGVPQGRALGTTRWLWSWQPSDVYTSVSALDGSDYKLLATTVQPSNFVYLGSPITTGTKFLFDAFVADDAGLAHGKIFSSDGVAPPQVYLEPTEPDTHFGSPIYANTYLAFFKGIHFLDVNKYGSVELWASPYSDNPSDIKPTKVAALAFTGMPYEPAGGWGFAVFGGTMAEPVGIWNLAKGTQLTHAVGDGYDVRGYPGVTRQHAYVGACTAGLADCFLMRFLNE